MEEVGGQHYNIIAAYHLRYSAGDSESGTGASLALCYFILNRA